MYNIELAKKIRINLIKMLYEAQSGHPGPSLSVVDILTAILKDYKDNDRLILSKGHAAPALYSALEMTGKIPKDHTYRLRELGSPMQGHPVRGTLPMIDCSTGSLGQGLSIGIGFALASKLKKTQNTIYVIMGDGETQEGQVWEAAMAASKFKLNNIIAIVDHNKLQNDGRCDEIMPHHDMIFGWKAFGWNTIQIDGHDIHKLIDAIYSCKKQSLPSMIIADTIKGKGISFMENSMEWHSKTINDEEYAKAIAEMEKQ